MKSESISELKTRIFSVKDELSFNKLAADVFRVQYNKNSIYRCFSDLLGFSYSTSTHYTNFPFLPVSFFGSHLISSSDKQAEIIFRSSGTTGMSRSNHHIFDLELYKRSILTGFHCFFGDPLEYCILGLIPKFSELTDSSLAFMLDVLVKASGHPFSGSYLGHEFELKEVLNTLPNEKKVLLFGISWALIDFGEKNGPFTKAFDIVETGGMKGRRKELIRYELHNKLKTLFGERNIRSEYSMCELQSQSWSASGGIFSCPPWMKVIIRDLYDPMIIAEPGRSGQVCIVDLANIHTCSFLATKDMGREIAPGQFEIMGRIDHSDLRGCSLLIDIS